MELVFGLTSLRLAQGDITALCVDAIVNPANSALVLGGGVAGAIRRAGGESIQRECDSIGGTPVGTAVISGGGRLKARYVIHAVGPRMGEGDEDRKLASATLSALRLADSHGLHSVALPAISTGVFGFPMERAARLMLETAADYLSSGEHSLREVTFCLFDGEALEVFTNALVKLKN
jgi:O-acetyl-ADP-ribose deacetylase